MGTCASTEYASKGGNGNNGWQYYSTVNIVHYSDGKLQQLKEPIKACHVLSENPNCILCSSESLYVGSPMPPVAPTEELQLNHLYFLVPMSKSRLPLSLHDMCALAIKANAALAHSKPTNSSCPSSVSQRNFQTHPILSNVSLGYSH